jgi:hypothetical protein
MFRRLKMRKLYPIILGALLMLTGCTETYTVYVNGFAKVTAPSPANIPIYVVSDSNSVNPIFDEEIKNKISKYLSSQGYVIQNNPAVDYHLTFQMGILPLLETDYRYMNTGAFGGRHHFHGGFDYYTPYIETVWNQWLRVKLYHDDTVIWVGEAATSRHYGDMRSTVDYLIVGALKFFGQDTGSQKALEISAKDPGIAAIEAYAK